MLECLDSSVLPRKRQQEKEVAGEARVFVLTPKLVTLSESTPGAATLPTYSPERSDTAPPISPLGAGLQGVTQTSPMGDWFLRKRAKMDDGSDAGVLVNNNVGQAAAYPPRGDSLIQGQCHRGRGCCDLNSIVQRCVVNGSLVAADVLGFLSQQLSTTTGNQSTMSHEI
jgi:hypothetical protein